MSNIIYLIPAFVAFAFSMYAGSLSRKELQFKAANRFMVTGIVLLPILGSFAFLDASYLNWYIASFGIILLFCISFFMGKFPKRSLSFAYDKEFRNRIDERETMFSRAELKKGTAHFNQYYAQHPEHLASDETIRKHPGLLNEGTYFYHKELFQLTRNVFKKIDGLQEFVEGKIHPKQKAFQEAPGIFYQKMGKELGAFTIGICKLKPEHYYTVGGRKERYNKIYHQEHSHAIVFTVEMNHRMMMFAPKAPTLLESANQYLHSGQIAIALAKHIRSMGYDARAHIDGNYKVIAPLVARDAGLGELGRMGLLMTPEIGPRVRIAVVTTNLEMETAGRKEDLSLLDFCLKCKKCAHNCPAQAISYNPPENISNAMRWQINQEKCFEYWTKAGTDCGRCVIVCPYAHPDNFLHNLARRGIYNSRFFRTFALKADDFYYGKKPKPLKIEEFEKLKPPHISDKDG